eukprot:360008-Chlamydomonas_euryale.AAC.5
MTVPCRHQAKRAATTHGPDQRRRRCLCCIHCMGPTNAAGAAFVASTAWAQPTPPALQVLTAANFTAAEAHSIYHQVNTDGGPGVGYEEFKEWWLKTLRVERMQKRPPCQMTAASLADNMQKMHALLQREGLTDIAEEFKVGGGCMERRERPKGGAQEGARR